MFNIKLEEKSYKMSSKALLVKMQRPKNGQGAQCPPPPGHIDMRKCTRLR